MDTIKKTAIAPVFEQAVLKAKVAQICDHVGYHTITLDSSNILVDLYRRLITQLGHYCKLSANNNRRVESTIFDLIPAFDIIGLSVSELQEHIETVKLPLNIDIQQDEQRPSNRIQRNLLVDDLLENEKNSHLEDAEDGENKAMSDNEDDEKAHVPLLKDAYEEIVSKIPACDPVSADKKVRLGGRIVFVANTKLKITAPIPPEPVPSTSGIESKVAKKKKRREVEKKQKVSDSNSSDKPTKGKRKKNISREFVLNEPSPEKELRLEESKAKEAVIEEIAAKDSEDELVRQEDDRIEREGLLEIDVREEKDDLEEERLNVMSDDLRKEKHLAECIPEEEKIRKSKGRGRGKEKEKEKSKNKAKSKDKKVKAKEKDILKSHTSKKNAPKKPKVIVTPLDPAIAEPPSFLPILETNVHEPKVEELQIIRPNPISLPELNTHLKQSKAKKKKKTVSQFAIETETVTKEEEKEYLCPTCRGPDDGDVMVECDTCQEWYHLRCIGLKKVPEDHETWECDLCIGKKKQAQKRPITPMEVFKVKLETPEPIVNTTTPPPPPPPVATGSTSQDDLCPECNLPDDGTLMIQCDDPFCAKWFHGKCVSLLEEPKEDESWFCKVCVDKQQSAFKRRRRAK